ncbi:MAG: hypothetical protein R8M11_03215 [Gallionella sp.]
MMIRLVETLKMWGTHEFDHAFKRELAKYPEALPLHQALLIGNYVADTPITVTVVNSFETQDSVHVSVGIFFQSVISGCNCADDPSPVSENSEYCELLIEIGKLTAETKIVLKD